MTNDKQITNMNLERFSDYILFNVTRNLYLIGTADDWDWVYGWKWGHIGDAVGTEQYDLAKRTAHGYMMLLNEIIEIKKRTVDIENTGENITNEIEYLRELKKDILEKINFVNRKNDFEKYLGVFLGRFEKKKYICFNIFKDVYGLSSSTNEINEFLGFCSEISAHSMQMHPKMKQNISITGHMIDDYHPIKEKIILNKLCGKQIPDLYVYEVSSKQVIKI